MQFLTGNWLYYIFGGLMPFIMFRGGGCSSVHSYNSNHNNKHTQDRGCCDKGQDGQNDQAIYKNKIVNSKIEYEIK